jgi:hypothetical protein
MTFQFFSFLGDSPVGNASVKNIKNKKKKKIQRERETTTKKNLSLSDKKRIEKRGPPGAIRAIACHRYSSVTHGCQLKLSLVSLDPSFVRSFFFFFKEKFIFRLCFSFLFFFKSFW